MDPRAARATALCTAISFVAAAVAASSAAVLLGSVVGLARDPDGG